MIIEIPDNATNGEVMKILFPIHKEIFTDYGTVKALGIDSEKLYTEFLVDWWGTPYRRENSNDN